MVEMTVCCRPGVCKVGNIVDQLMMSVWLEVGEGTQLHQPWQGHSLTSVVDCWQTPPSVVCHTHVSPNLVLSCCSPDIWPVHPSLLLVVLSTETELLILCHCFIVTLFIYQKCSLILLNTNFNNTNNQNILKEIYKRKFVINYCILNEKVKL